MRVICGNGRWYPLRKLLSNFPNSPGVHCASKALADLATYFGCPLSEPLAFGLAAGLGAYFVNSMAWPRRTLIGRHWHLEEEFFRTLGISFSWSYGPGSPWESIRDCIVRDIPVLILADLKYVEYYDTVSAFGGHTMVIVGFDDEDETVFVSDIHQPAYQRTSLTSLRKSLASSTFPNYRPNQWGAVAELSAPDLTKVITEALTKNARNLLQSDNNLMGIRGLKAFSSDLYSWGTFPYWKECAIVFYELSERRGSGGSSFRRLYAQFLTEASHYVPLLTEIGAAERMQSIADDWNYVARILLEAGRRGNAVRLADASAVVKRIAEAEELLFRDLLQLQT